MSVRTSTWAARNRPTQKHLQLWPHGEWKPGPACCLPQQRECLGSPPVAPWSPRNNPWCCQVMKPKSLHKLGGKHELWQCWDASWLGTACRQRCPVYQPATRHCSRVKQLEFLVFVTLIILALIGFNCSLNNYNIKTGVLKKGSLKTAIEPAPETLCV